MFKYAGGLLAGAALLGSISLPAQAADIYQPPEVAPPEVVYKEASYGGWYIRGDVDYHWSKLRGTEYITYGPPPGTSSFETTDLDGAWSVGGGIGYQVNSYFRTDLTADYWFKSDFRGSTSGVCGGLPCTSTDESAVSTWLLLANAYVDLGTWHGVTPYVGAGIGGAYVKWDDLRNTINGTTFRHDGSAEWRFAWALMAGASYCLTENLNLDVGYRFSRIHGGRMFEFASDVGPGFDEGFNTHEVRAGLRYQFGGGNPACYPPEPVIAYEPPAEPPVYK